MQHSSDSNPPFLRRVRTSITVVRSLARAILGRSDQIRYEARYGLMRRLAHSLGFELYNSNLVWQDDGVYREQWARFPERTSEVKDRHFVLFEMARSVANLTGDTAECGVFAGAGSFLICAATQKAGRVHHIFDSFEGLSAPTSEDTPDYSYTYRWKKHDLAVPQDRVQRNLAAFDHVAMYKGWIPDRFDAVRDSRFAFVHVDVDLEQPTRDSLEFFYPRLVPGGILLCDDYGSAACPGAKRAFDELIRDKPERTVVHLPTGQGFIVKR